MTLLEAVLALAILGLSATGILGAYQGALHASRETDAWITAVGYAEAAMELSKTGAATPASHDLPDGYREELTITPLHSGLALVRVRITLPDHREYVVERIAKS